MRERAMQLYFKALHKLKELEFDRRQYENFYLWGRGKELRQTKLKIAIVERMYENR